MLTALVFAASASVPTIAPSVSFPVIKIKRKGPSGCAALWAGISASGDVTFDCDCVDDGDPAYTLPLDGDSVTLEIVDTVDTAGTPWTVTVTHADVAGPVAWDRAPDAASWVFDAEAELVLTVTLTAPDGRTLSAEPTIRIVP